MLEESGAVAMDTGEDDTDQEFYNEAVSVLWCMINHQTVPLCMEWRI